MKCMVSLVYDSVGSMKCMVRLVYVSVGCMKCMVRMLQRNCSRPFAQTLTTGGVVEHMSRHMTYISSYISRCQPDELPSERQSGRDGVMP